MTLKQKIYKSCMLKADERINSLRKILADLKESGANETKSTAGDKHETALAMLQIEQANTRGQLEDALHKKATLEKINPQLSAGQIVNGSLVRTNSGYLFISVALGKITHEGIDVITLSPQSPLGEKLIGLGEGEAAVVNGNRFEIITVE